MSSKSPECKQIINEVSVLEIVIFIFYMSLFACGGIHQDLGPERFSEESRGR